MNQCIHKSRSPSRKILTATILNVGSNICWFTLEDIEALRVLLYRSFHSSMHESTIVLRARFCVLLLTLSLPVHQNAHVNKLSVCDKLKFYSSRCLFYFRCSAVNIFKYKGKYLCRRIPHASHGSFNPFVISNKEAHIINGNIQVRTKETDETDVATISELPGTGTNDRRPHFMNSCLTHPEKFSCAIDCFLELNYAIFKDFISHVE